MITRYGGQNQQKERAKMESSASDYTAFNAPIASGFCHTGNYANCTMTLKTDSKSPNLVYRQENQSGSLVALWSVKIGN